MGLYQLRAGSALIDLVPVDGPLGSKGGAAPGRRGTQPGSFLPPGRTLRCRCHHRPSASAWRRSRAGRLRYGAEGQGPSIYVSDPEGNVVELKGPPARCLEASRRHAACSIKPLACWPCASGVADARVGAKRSGRSGHGAFGGLRCLGWLGVTGLASGGWFGCLGVRRGRSAFTVSGELGRFGSSGCLGRLGGGRQRRNRVVRHHPSLGSGDHQHVLP